ncbi:hypothetical protein M9980_09295 [Sphingomonas donggukensis]|uniref:DUF4034 domain-containing protein n=1 Tax=Sphingomonas donggukensis TaxID=2949093 RepID=A0ABY4TS66_9SPHN|nr:hypothetical protein [Sphingomonas donggukensis]URW74769.1 hypothetical protein M9980_09295 [Sphingomonas donggukensis]
MLKWVMFVAAAILAMPAAAQAPVAPPCRTVGPADFIRIDPASAAALGEIGLDRATIFERMRETSIPETMGCWAMPVGNFDSQLISVGMAQWNYGTGSLQPILTAWREGFGSRRKFRTALDTLAPTYGRLLLLKDCLAVPVRQRCRDGILAAHGADGRIAPALAAELTAIFESDAMVQVQADAYVALLMEVRTELLRLWPASAVTMRKVRWAIDTRVQQRTLPGDEDAYRLRVKLAAVRPEEWAPRLYAILDWYRGLAQSVDQDGIAKDYAWNVAQWRCLIDTRAIDPEQYELLHLTFLRSRTATGNSGRWQALTFSRRAKIVLGVGSVSGVRDGACVQAIPNQGSVSSPTTLPAGT